MPLIDLRSSWIRVESTHIFPDSTHPHSITNPAVVEAYDSCACAHIDAAGNSKFRISLAVSKNSLCTCIVIPLAAEVKKEKGTTLRHFHSYMLFFWDCFAATRMDSGGYRVVMINLDNFLYGN